jgi:WD40 repeat protein
MRIKYLRVSDLTPVKLAPVYYTKSEIDPDASMSFSNDGKFFISQYQYADQFSFDGETLKRETKYAVSEKFHNMITSINAFNGKLFTGLHNGDIHVYDSKTKKYNDVLKGHKTDVTAMTSFAAGNWLVSGDANGLILIWDTKSNTLLQALKGTNEQITCFSMKEDESVVLIGYLNGDIKYWDRITQETRKINLQKVQAKAVIGFNYVITSIDPYTNDSIVNFDCSYGFSIRKNMFDHIVYYKGKWNINTNKLQLVEIGTEFQERAIVTSPMNFYKIMYEGAGSNPHLKDTSDSWVVSAIGNVIYTNGNSGTKYIYTSHQGDVSKVKIAGNTLYTAGWDGTIKWYDLVSGEEKLTMGINGRSGFFYFMPSGFYYASKKRCVIFPSVSAIMFFRLISLTWCIIVRI